MQHFAIVAMARSGSTRLCDVLGRHPQIACHHEIFHPERVQAFLPRSLDIFDVARRDADRRGFLDRLLALNERSFSGRSLSGFKVMLDRSQMSAALDVVAPDPRLKKIVLYRENLLAAYLSLELALATGIWQSPDRRAEAPETPKLRFDWHRFFSLVGRHMTTRAALETALGDSGQPFLRIEYRESLTAAGMERVWAYLGVSAASLDSSYAKVNARRAVDCFDNPEECRDALRIMGRSDWLDA